MSISKKQEKFLNGKKIRKVTVIPNWILRIKGRIDARNGPEVPDAYVEKMYKKLKSFDDYEVRTAENILKAPREAAALNINTLSESSQTIATTNIPHNDGSARGVRGERTARGKVASAMATSSNSSRSIYSINELIISVNSHLQTRIDQTYLTGLEKCKAYECGVKRKLPDYSIPDFDMNSDAVNKYQATHKVLDDAVKAETYKCINNTEEE